MPLNARRVGVCALLGTALFGAASSLLTAAGARLNTTPSAPNGLWRVSAAPSPIRRGELVEVCPPPAPVVRLAADRGWIERGDCPAGTIPLLKAVGAIAGDQVQITSGGLARINGQTAPNTAALAGIPAWPDGIYTVPAGTVWLLSSYSPNSFDSRYFGPVPVGLIRGEARPVLVAGSAAGMAAIEEAP